MNRIPEERLVEIKKCATSYHLNIYPKDVIELLSALREAYAEIDRLNRERPIPTKRPTDGAKRWDGL